jgi:hypothetical protein
MESDERWPEGVAFFMADDDRLDFQCITCGCRVCDAVGP